MRIFSEEARKVICSRDVVRSEEPAVYNAGQKDEAFRKGEDRMTMLKKEYGMNVGITNVDDALSALAAAEEMTADLLEEKLALNVAAALAENFCRQEKDGMWEALDIATAPSDAISDFSYDASIIALVYLIHFLPKADGDLFVKVRDTVARGLRSLPKYLFLGHGYDRAATVTQRVTKLVGTDLFGLAEMGVATELEDYWLSLPGRLLTLVREWPSFDGKEVLQEVESILTMFAMKEGFQKRCALREGEQYYLAYGSNMDETQMEKRCPGARKLTAAVIKGHRLVYGNKCSRSNFATIIPAEGYYVPVLVWAITEKHINKLDSYEGVSSGCYDKKCIYAELGACSFNGLIYIMPEDMIIGEPEIKYKEKVDAALIKMGFAPSKFVSEENL